MADYYLIEKLTADAIYNAIKDRYELASMTLGEVAGDKIAEAISMIPTSAGGDPVNPMTISISQAAYPSVSVNTIRILTQSEWGTETKNATTLYIIVENNT